MKNGDFCYSIFIIKTWAMKRVIRLTEGDLIRVVRRVIKESRNLIDSTEPYNIIPVDSEDIPNELINIWDSAVNYWSETKDELNLELSDRVEVSPGQVIYSTQGKVDNSIIDRMTDEEYSEGDIVIVDYNGRLWIFNGHHRVIRDRKNGRSSMVYIIDEGMVGFINRIIYGEGDEDY